MPSKDKEKNAEYFRRWYEKNKQTQIERVKAQSEKIYREVLEYKESKPCMDCGVIYPYYVMDFDHVRGEKKKNVSSIMRRGSRKQIWEEIDKCDLVCANSHRIRTHNRRKANW